MDGIIKELNDIFVPQFGLALRLWRWEVDAYPAFHLEGLQGQIDQALQIDNCDIMVGIFWKRFGTPVKDADSGTAHELNRAYKSWQDSGGKRPHIMVYFKIQDYTCKDAEEEQQKAKLLAYRKELSRVSLSWEYSTRNDFEKFVRDHLLKYLLKNLGRLGGKTYTIVQSNPDLMDFSMKIVNESQKILFTSGSRSRDEKYLKSIEQKLIDCPQLVHYRVLFGPPHHAMLKKHLLDLLKIRNPSDRSQGFKTIHLGLFEDFQEQFETFILGNEREILLISPSLSGVGQYNTAIVFTGKEYIDGMGRFVKDLYGRSKKIETAGEINVLKVLKDQSLN